MKFILLAVALCLAMVAPCSAEQGCLSNASGYIYITPEGVVNGVPNYQYRSEADRVPGANVYCRTNTTNPTTTCQINSYVSGTSSNPNGVMVNFYYVNCPLDDYAPLLVLLVGGLGWFLIRQSRLAYA